MSTPLSIEDVSEEQLNIPDSPNLPPPDVATPEPKKRGRKPYPRDAAGNIIRPDGTTAKPVNGGNGVTRVTAVTKDKGLTDEQVGQAFDGIFMVTSVGLGAHWRLFPHEATQLGKAFGPLARRYPGKLDAWIDILVLAPVTASIVLPRAIIQKATMDGNIAKADTRKALLNVLMLMEAEKKMNLSQMAESEEVKQTLQNFANGGT